MIAWGEPFGLVSDSASFSGHQPDDFGAAAFLGNPRRLCLLGAGAGACIHTVSALLPEAALTVVDSNRYILKVAEGVAGLAGISEVRYVEEDAHSYLAQQRPRSFDAILIDIFESDRSYSPLMLNPGFWREVDRVLEHNGHVLVNVWGRPSHLWQIRPEPFESKVAAFVSTCLSKNAQILHGRRNSTLIFGSIPERLTWIGDDVHESAWKRPIDALMASLLYRRVKHAIPRPSQRALTHISGRDGGVASLEADFVRASAAFKRQIPGLDRYQNKSLRRALLDRSFGSELLAKTLTVSPEAAAMVPSHVSAYRADGEASYDWYLDWFTEKASSWAAEHPEWFWRYGAWQAASSLAAPLAPPYPRSDFFIQEMRSIIEEHN